MAEGTVLAPTAPPLDHGRTAVGPGGPTRTVRRRQPLPSGRAVVGGFLVALSAVGVFLAWSEAAGGPDTEYAVAARDLPVGTALTGADLRMVAMELPTSFVAIAAFDDARDLVGVKVVNPIRAGELVQASSLVVSDGASNELEVSFPIERSKAVGGSLKPGEFVDVLATFGAGADTYTTTVLASARILDIEDAGSTLGSEDDRLVTLAVADSNDARALTHAVNVAKLMLVRARVADGKADQGGTYRAPAASEPPRD